MNTSLSFNIRLFFVILLLIQSFGQVWFFVDNDISLDDRTQNLAYAQSAPAIEPSSDCQECTWYETNWFWIAVAEVADNSSVIPPFSLIVDKNSPTTEAVIGEFIEYTITITNDMYTWDMLRLIDDYDEQSLSFVNVISSSWIVLWTPFEAPTWRNQMLIRDNLSIAPWTTAEIVLRFEVIEDAYASYENNIIVWIMNNERYDEVLGTEYTSSYTVVAPPMDLKIDKEITEITTDVDGYLVPGTELIFRLNIENDSASAFDNIIIRDQLLGYQPYLGYDSYDSDIVWAPIQTIGTVFAPIVPGGNDLRFIEASIWTWTDVSLPAWWTWFIEMTFIAPDTCELDAYSFQWNNYAAISLHDIDKERVDILDTADVYVGDNADVEQFDVEPELCWQPWTVLEEPFDYILNNKTFDAPWPLLPWESVEVTFNMSFSGDTNNHIHNVELVDTFGDDFSFMNMTANDSFSWLTDEPLFDIMINEYPALLAGTSPERNGHISPDYIDNQVPYIQRNHSFEYRSKDSTAIQLACSYDQRLQYACGFDAWSAWSTWVPILDANTEVLINVIDDEVENYIYSQFSSLYTSYLAAGNDYIEAMYLTQMDILPDFHDRYQTNIYQSQMWQDAIDQAAACEWNAWYTNSLRLGSLWGGGWISTIQQAEQDADKSVEWLLENYSSLYNYAPRWLENVMIADTYLKYFHSFFGDQVLSSAFSATECADSSSWRAWGRVTPWWEDIYTALKFWLGFEFFEQRLINDYESFLYKCDGAKEDVWLFYTDICEEDRWNIIWQSLNMIEWTWWFCYSVSDDWFASVSDLWYPRDFIRNDDDILTSIYDREVTGQTSFLQENRAEDTTDVYNVNIHNIIDQLPYVLSTKMINPTVLVDGVDLGDYHLCQDATVDISFEMQATTCTAWTYQDTWVITQDPDISDVEDSLLNNSADNSIAISTAPVVDITVTSSTDVTSLLDWWDVFQYTARVCNSWAARSDIIYELSEPNSAWAGIPIPVDVVWYSWFAGATYENTSWNTWLWENISLAAWACQDLVVDVEIQPNFSIGSFVLEWRAWYNVQWNSNYMCIDWFPSDQTDDISIVLRYSDEINDIDNQSLPESDKTVSPLTAAAWSTITYTLTFRNDLPYDAIVDVEDVYNEHLTFLNVASSSLALPTEVVDLVWHTVSWSWIELPAYTLLTIELEFEVDADAEPYQPLTNRYEYSFVVPPRCICEQCGDWEVHENEWCDDGNFDNFDGCSDMCLMETLDLALQKVEISEWPYTIWDVIDFDIVIENQGWVDWSNIEIVDYVPSEFSLVTWQWWTMSGENAYYSATWSLWVMTSLNIPLSFEVLDVSNAEVFNYAEIASHDDVDSDSASDVIQNNDCVLYSGDMVSFEDCWWVTPFCISEFEEGEFERRDSSINDGDDGSFFDVPSLDPLRLDAWLINLSEAPWTDGSEFVYSLFAPIWCDGKEYDVIRYFGEVDGWAWSVRAIYEADGEYVSDEFQTIDMSFGTWSFQVALPTWENWDTLIHICESSSVLTPSSDNYTWWSWINATSCAYLDDDEDDHDYESVELVPFELWACGWIYASWWVLYDMDNNGDALDEASLWLCQVWTMSWFVYEDHERTWSCEASGGWESCVVEEVYCWDGESWEEMSCKWTVTVPSFNDDVLEWWYDDTTYVTDIVLSNGVVLSGLNEEIDRFYVEWAGDAQSLIDLLEEYVPYFEYEIETQTNCGPWIAFCSTREIIHIVPETWSSVMIEEVNTIHRVVNTNDAEEVCIEIELFPGGPSSLDCFDVPITTETEKAIIFYNECEVVYAESCDDGNEDNWDGCNAVCEMTTNAWCGDVDNAVFYSANWVATVTEGMEWLCNEFWELKVWSLVWPNESWEYERICVSTEWWIDAMCTADENQCGDGQDDGTEVFDNWIAAAEWCDDGNNEDNDGCNASCVLESCGDWFQQEWEWCDDGNDEDNDGCSAVCKIERCGDGVKQSEEACDDSNVEDNDGCNSICELERCGDGVKQTSEACDDGNNENDDGCNSVCEEELCGDGVMQLIEACDDGNDENNDGCTNACVLTYCWDGTIQNSSTGWPNSEWFQEWCDDGNEDATDGCHECVVTSCGDGIIQSINGEQCDDGKNWDDYDGCTDSCVTVSCEYNGHIYLDADYNKLYDASVDVPQENYEVTLMTEDGVLVWTTLTNEDWYYEFIELDCQHGYTANYENMSDYSADSAQDTWVNGVEQQDNPLENASGTDQAFVENPSFEDPDNNFWLIVHCAVDGVVYLDVNQNKIYDDWTDIPQSSIDVTLGGQTIQTDEDGYYRFEGLSCYEEHVVSYDQVAATWNADSAQNEDWSQDASTPLTQSEIPSGEFNIETWDLESLNNDFGLVVEISSGWTRWWWPRIQSTQSTSPEEREITEEETPVISSSDIQGGEETQEEGASAIEGTVYLDDEDDDSYEQDAWLQDIQVELTNKNGELFATTTTDWSWWYLFEDLPVGEYCVTYTNSTQYHVDSSKTWYEKTSWWVSMAIGNQTHCMTISNTNQYSIENDFWLIYLSDEIKEMKNRTLSEPFALPVYLPKTWADF